MPKFIVGVDCAERQFYTVEAPTEDDADEALRRHLNGNQLCDGTSVALRIANDPEYNLDTILVDTAEEFGLPEKCETCARDMDRGEPHTAECASALAQDGGA